MKTVVVRLLNNVTYLNVILTIIALLLAIQLAHNMDFFDVRKAHAKEIMAVHIESVAGNIPVAIKAPISTYPASVCVTQCR
jgi:hypothetical protein